jgi:8-oxo-dGTP pyrophosphatase MutT (NUDIX family)
MNPHQQVLLADEVFKSGTHATKYPGGGLEFGEGLIDCLKREFIEETGIAVEIKEHFYTTDFFVASAYDNDSQVISIYYIVESKDWQKIKTSTKKFDLQVEPGKQGESFRWVHIQYLETENTIILPIDKLVTEKLIAAFA